MKLSRIKDFFTTKLRNRYRLIIRNDLNLEERISVVLTPLNVVLILSGLLVVFTAIAIFLLPMTPLRYFMPGGGEINPRDFTVLKHRLDSIEKSMLLQEQRDSNLYRILIGDTTDEVSQVQPWPIAPASNGFSFFANAYAAGPDASKEKASEEAIDLTRNVSEVNYAFCTPLKGAITDTFSLRNQHTAVDVTSYSNAAIKATLDGTVVISTWTPETGHIMLLQHTNNFLSVYKHNSVLLKKLGDQVQAGEVIALMGNSGELTSGPHLHFELWHNGQAVNPKDYIKF